MTIVMPRFRSGGAGAPRRDRRGAARDRAGRGRDRGASRDAALRDRRADRLSPAAAGGGAAATHRAGVAGPAILPRQGIKVVPRGAGTSLSGGALPLDDGVLARHGASSTASCEIDFDNRVVVVQPGVTNLAISQAVAHAGLLLRARSVVADRLHHRRQYRGELRRRALPEIRRDHQQRARRARWC